MFSDHANQITKAKRFEKEGKWEEALKVWDNLPEESYGNEANAVRMIIESNKKGDRFRALAKKLRVENRGLSENEILRRANKIVYGE